MNQHINRSQHNLADQDEKHRTNELNVIRSLFCDLAQKVKAREGQLVIHGAGVITLRHDGDQLHADWLPHQTSTASSTATTGPRAGTRMLRVPIEYADVTIGEIRIDCRSHGDRDFVLATCEEAAREFALLAKRHEVYTWTMRHFGAGLHFVGRSLALREVELFVERACQTKLPVLIEGEFGTEAPLTAAAIHFLSSNPSAPFVEFQCPAQPPEGGAHKIAECLEAARSGTLFFHSINELSPHLMHQLPELLGSRVGQYLAGNNDERSVRIIASTTTNLHQMVQDGHFPKTLLVELDFLSIRLPPLRERLDDISLILEHLLEKNGFSALEKCSDDLLTACRAYTWPENLFEIERVVARLAAMTGRAPISRADIEKHTPWVMDSRITTGVSHASRLRSTSDANPSRLQHASAGSVQQWVLAVVHKDLSITRKLHPNLQKALAYLSENFSEQVSLGQLAKHACISPRTSHISSRARSASRSSPFWARCGSRKRSSSSSKRRPCGSPTSRWTSASWT